jgi:hypothetical protein
MTFTATSSCQEIASETQCQYTGEASGTPAVYAGFTAGEILNSLLIFMLLLGAFTAFIVFKFSGIRIKGKNQ